MSNYFSFFEILAGVSSALVGFDLMRSTVTKFGVIKLDRLIEDFGNNHKKSLAIADQYKKLFTHIPNIEPIAKRRFRKNQDPIKTCGDAATYFKDKLTQLREYKKTEETKVDRKVNAFFVYLFFSCLFIIIVGAMQNDGIVHCCNAMRLVKFYILSSIFSVGILSMLMSWDKAENEHPVPIAILSFIATAEITIAILRLDRIHHPSCFQLGLNEETKVLIITIAFISPALYIMSRGIVYWSLVSALNFFQSARHKLKLRRAEKLSGKYLGVSFEGIDRVIDNYNRLFGKISQNESYSIDNSDEPVLTPKKSDQYKHGKEKGTQRQRSKKQSLYPRRGRRGQ